MADSPAPGARQLSPHELAARLDRILACAEALIASVPMPYTEHRSAGGDRSIRELAFHVFRLGLAFADGMDMGELSSAWLREAPPADLDDGAAVARYGALVRGRLGGWFEGAGPGEYARAIRVAGSAISGHDLLGRVTGHVAAHLRRLYAMADEIGVAAPLPIPSADLESLPQPANLW